MKSGVCLARLLHWRTSRSAGTNLARGLQKVTLLASTAVLADEFVLTHRNVLSAHTSAKLPLVNVESLVALHAVHSSKSETPSKFGRKFVNSGERRVCFFCLDPNHLIADCKAWKQKRVAYRVNPQKRVNMQAEVGYMLHHGIPVLSQRSPLPRSCHVRSKLQIAFQTASGCKCRRSWCGSATGG